MRNLLFRLILAILPLVTMGQSKTVTINLPGELADKAWVRSYVDSVRKADGSTATPPVTVVPGCKRGPTIGSVISASSSAVTIQFDGEAVTEIGYDIKQKGAGLIESGSINPESNIITLPFPTSPDGIYTVIIRGKNCKSEKDSEKDFAIKSNATGGVILPPVPLNGKSKVLGAYSARSNGRNFTYNQTPELAIRFNPDGSISDATEGLDNSGPITRLNGQNVFYMTGNGWFEKSDGSYEKLENVTFPDGAVTIKQFVCNPSRIPDYATFKRQLIAYGEGGVNTLTSRMSQILLSIHSDQKVGQGIGRDWLVVSRALNFPSALPGIDWRPYNKWVATAGVNLGDDQDKYRRVGIIPDARFGEPNQAMTFNTVKVGQNQTLTADEAYATGRAFANYMGSSPYSYITEELVENGQGRYDNPGYLAGVEVSYHFARGSLDDMRVRNPGLNKKDAGIFGGYGGDDFYSLIDQQLLYSDRKTYEQSLTDKLFKGHSVHGFTAEDHPYYARGHIDVRNVNAKYYFWNRIYNLPYEFIALNERIKLATKTYQGQDRESNVTIFSCPFIESFVSDDRGNKVNIEQALTGELIEYPNGTMLTRMNTAPTMAWDEALTAGFWSTFINSGMAMWDAPRTTYGMDTTRVHLWSDQPFLWRKKGEKDFRKYEPGINGAPENSGDGLKHSLHASPIDAMAAGMEAAWEIRDRSAKKSFISYRSSRGEFIAKPGSAGFHLNGSGVPNYNLFVVRDAFDQKKGICIVGEGPEGTVLVYYNGFLSAHLYEDDVTVRYNGVEYNMGRAYGRQTIIKKL